MYHLLNHERRRDCEGASSYVIKKRLVQYVAGTRSGRGTGAEIYVMKMSSLINNGRAHFCPSASHRERCGLSNHLSI